MDSTLMLFLITGIMIVIPVNTKLPKVEDPSKTLPKTKHNVFVVARIYPIELLKSNKFALSSSSSSLRFGGSKRNNVLNGDTVKNNPNIIQGESDDKYASVNLVDNQVNIETTTTAKPIAQATFTTSATTNTTPTLTTEKTIFTGEAATTNTVTSKLSSEATVLANENNKSPSDDTTNTNIGTSDLSGVTPTSLMDKTDSVDGKTSTKSTSDSEFGGVTPTLSRSSESTLENRKRISTDPKIFTKEDKFTDGETQTKSTSKGYSVTPTHNTNSESTQENSNIISSEPETTKEDKTTYYNESPTKSTSASSNGSTLGNKNIISSKSKTTAEDMSTKPFPESRNGTVVTTTTTTTKPTQDHSRQSTTTTSAPSGNPKVNTDPTSKTIIKTEHSKECVCKEESPTKKSPLKKESQKKGEFSDEKEMFKNFKPPVTTQSHDNKHYRLADYIIKYIFKHYPEYQVPLLAKLLANGTTHQAFSGMVMEFQQPNNYDILVTDSYSQVHDGSLRKVEQYPSLYQCSKAIRYCSINPKFCQYQEGDYDTNIIIVVPHGGNYMPGNIPQRTPGCYINGKCVYAVDCGTMEPVLCPIETRPEKYTKKIAFKLANHLKNLTGSRPHVIIMELHRSIVDVDRNREEGAYNDLTRSAWYDFHNFINLAKMKISGEGLLIDLHSHLHKHGLVELSYGLSKSQLMFSSEKVNMDQSSLRSLVKTYKMDHESILRGDRSLGEILYRRHVEAVPSPNFPAPPIGAGYTEKQTITKLYGSLYEGRIDAVRVSVARKYGAKKRSKIFSRLLAESIKEFMDLNYEKEK